MSLKRWRNGNLKCEASQVSVGSEASTSASETDGPATGLTVALASDLHVELGLGAPPHQPASALPGGWKESGILGDGTYGVAYAVSPGAAGSADGSAAGSAACKLLEGGTSMYSFQDAAREAFGLGAAGLLTGIAHGSALGGHDGTALVPKTALFMPLLGARIGNSVVPKFSPPIVAALLRPIAEALASMTGMHRDVKPANILVPVRPGAKASIIDFSLATAQTESSDFNVVTLWYRPPEILLKERYGRKVDVWAFGIVLFNLLTGCHINRASSETQLDSLLLDLVTYFGMPKSAWPALNAKLDSIAGGHGRMPQTGILNLTSIVADASGQSSKTPMVRYAADLLQACLRVSPAERADWTQVLESPFMRLADRPVQGVPHGPPVVKQVPTLDGDLDAFLGTAAVVPVAPLSWPTQPTSETVTQSKINAVDHLLHYGKKLGFRVETCILAYWLCRYAASGATTQRLSACLFLAASFNEDTRVKAPGWRAWASAWDESDHEAMRAAVLPTLVAIGGRWPSVDMPELLRQAADAGGPAWVVPFVVALAQLPAPTRPGVRRMASVVSAADIVQGLLETVRRDAASIMSRS
jgi:hypothetical protein